MKKTIYARERSNKERNSGLFYFIIGIIVFCLGAPFSVFVALSCSLLIWLIASHYFRYAHIWHLGAVGEEKVAKILEDLGDSYHVMNDFHWKGQRGNFDHIVIGPNGIFMIETKNHKGIIRCDGERWRQEKVGGLGTVYEGVLRNPAHQVRKNSARFNDFMKMHLNKNFWVSPIIVFTNEEADFHINNPTVPVFTPGKLSELCGFIKNHRSEKLFTGKELLDIKNLEKMV